MKLKFYPVSIIDHLHSEYFLPMSVDPFALRAFHFSLVIFKKLFSYSYLILNTPPSQNTILPMLRMLNLRLSESLQMFSSIFICLLIFFIQMGILGLLNFKTLNLH